MWVFVIAYVWMWCSVAMEVKAKDQVLKEALSILYCKLVKLMNTKKN